LESKYKTLFEEADQNDYQAFRVHRQGMENLIVATLAYLKFEKISSQAFQ